MRARRPRSQSGSNSDGFLELREQCIDGFEGQDLDVPTYLRKGIRIVL